jgi:hypothetical protein
MHCANRTKLKVVMAAPSEAPWTSVARSRRNIVSLCAQRQLPGKHLMDYQYLYQVFL